jgi:hypothetical protein
MMMYESRNKSILLTAAVLLTLAVSTTILFVDAIDHDAVKEASEVCTLKRFDSIRFDSIQSFIFVDYCTIAAATATAATAATADRRVACTSSRTVVCVSLCSNFMSVHSFTKRRISSSSFVPSFLH